MAKFARLVASEFFCKHYPTMVVYSVMNEETKAFEGIYFRYYVDEVEHAVIVHFNTVNNEIMLKIPERIELAYSTIIDFVYEAERQIRSGQLEQAIEYYNFDQFRGDKLDGLPEDQNISTIVTEKVMKENDYNVRELEIERLQKEIARLRKEQAMGNKAFSGYSYTLHGTWTTADTSSPTIHMRRR